MNLADILEGAGLGHLIGSSKYSWRVHNVMSKKSPQYRREDANKPPPFVYGIMDNRSPFIQEKYGNPNEPIKPFDHCKAQKRREDLSDYDKKWEAVHKPEYWGLRWGKKGASPENAEPDELFPYSNGGKGQHWATKDGISFPPVKYRDGAKLYFALACCFGEPVGTTRVYNENGKTVHRNRKNVRRSMLFFRSDDMPNFTHLPEFSQAATYERDKTKKKNGATYQTTVDEKQSVRRIPGTFGQTEPLRRPITVKKNKVLYTGIVLRKTYNGVELVGTDRVMAQGRRGEKAPTEINSFEDIPKPINLQGKRNMEEEASEARRAAAETPEQRRERREAAESADRRAARLRNRPITQADTDREMELQDRERAAARAAARAREREATLRAIREAEEYDAEEDRRRRG